jgi:hypothetical protein
LTSVLLGRVTFTILFCHYFDTTFSLNHGFCKVLYLQDHKQALWEKFHEQYPNGMHRTTFMMRLDGKRFVYKEDLGGLCSECNECGYQVFANIEELININITDLVLRVRFI